MPGALRDKHLNELACEGSTSQQRPWPRWLILPSSTQHTSYTTLRYLCCQSRWWDGVECGDLLLETVHPQIPQRVVQMQINQDCPIISGLRGQGQGYPCHFPGCIKKRNNYCSNKRLPLLIQLPIHSLSQHHCILKMAFHCPSFILLNKNVRIIFCKYLEMCLNKKEGKNLTLDWWVAPRNVLKDPKWLPAAHIEIRQDCMSWFSYRRTWPSSMGTSHHLGIC